MPRKRSSDPHFQREAAKYENPIPSREFILEFMAEKGTPLPFPAILSGLSLYSEEHEIALDRRLNAMARAGQLIKNRRELWCLPDKMSLKPARVEAIRDGSGFAILDEAGDDWVVSAREMRKVLHGDRVLVSAQGKDRRGRVEAVIVEVLDETPRHIVGRFQLDRGVGFIVPSDARINADIIVPPGDEGGAKKNQMVVALLTQRGQSHSQPLAKVVEVLGDHLAPGMEVEVAVRQFDLPFQFSAAVEAEIAELSPVVAEADKKGRIDLRDKALVTIDGEDAKDFDDAVYCERKKGGGWRLWVAIADVSHYVRLNTALDEEAQKRGNSVYFPGSVIPMLPELLSNGLCSLKPKVDRLCLVCEMTISEAGSLSSYRFYPAVMRSQQRFTYTRVWSLLEGDAPANDEEAALLPALQELHALYQVLASTRKQRGAIELETRETKVLFNDERKIEKIVPMIRNDAHKLIEECMILANVASAKYLHKAEMPALYRVHDGPNQRKLEALREQLSALGLYLGGGDEPTPKDYAVLAAKASQRPDADNIQLLLLRSLTQAVYQPEMNGHFGLALASYTHFTSPIRRYPDLIVHRAIKAQLSKTDQEMVGNEGAYHYDTAELEVLGSECSMTERRADEASRDVTAWLKCEYMKDKIGEVCQGHVTSVAGFGLFVELNEIFVEGLVHVSSLHNDYYQYDAARQLLKGERTGERFGLGDQILVRVADVDLDQRKIDFHFVKRATDAVLTEGEMTEDDMRARRLASIRKALARETGQETLPDSARKSGRKSSSRDVARPGHEPPELYDSSRDRKRGPASSTPKQKKGKRVKSTAKATTKAPSAVRKQKKKLRK